jgi:type VI secretion system protein ImpM
MSKPVIGLPGGSVLHGASVGFCGKLPARGDFVSVGLARSFVEKWHDWMQRMLAASRQALGEDWLPTWNVAPIWRFALSPGICGPDAVLGLWMPSVDGIGRQFPLTFAAVVTDASPAALIRDGGIFLSLAEAAGLDALALDLEPCGVAARLDGDRPDTQGAAALAPVFGPYEGALWWSIPCDHVATGAVTFVTRELPDESLFGRMLQPGRSVGGTECPKSR